MDAIAKWGSTLIVLINTIFGIISLVFVVTGFLVKYAADKIDSIAGSMIGAAKEKIPDQASKYLNTDDLKVSEFVGGSSAALIATGCILLAVVFWAYCGTCCKSRLMLTIYAIILSVIILGEVAMVIILTTNRQLIDKTAKDSLMTSLKQYKGGKGKNAQSRAWNAVMGLLECCGVNGVEDFDKIDGWKTQEADNGSVTINSNNMAAPYICCANQSSHCPDKLYSNNYQYNEGCYDALWDLVDSKKAYVIGIGVCLGLFEVLIWFLTVWLIKELRKTNKVAPT